jgi:hypothetical protein
LEILRFLPIAKARGFRAYLWVKTGTNRYQNLFKASISEADSKERQSTSWQIAAYPLQSGFSQNYLVYYRK